MLTISTAARDAIASIQRRSVPSGEAGLRIVRASGDNGGFQVRAVPGPPRGDRAFDYDGARVFLGPHAVSHLQRHLLDVRRDDSGRLEFVCSVRT